MSSYFNGSGFPIPGKGSLRIFSNKLFIIFTDSKIGTHAIQFQRIYTFRNCLHKKPTLMKWAYLFFKNAANSVKLILSITSLYLSLVSAID